MVSAILSFTVLLQLSSTSWAVTRLGIETKTVSSATLGHPYLEIFKASGGVAPLRWKVSSGHVPAGLRFTTSGTLTGTPTRLDFETFRVTVTDSAKPARSSSKSFSLAVTAATLPYGQSMRAGEFLTSSGGQFTLDMQSDGNLVEYFEGDPLWSTSTAGHPGAYAAMQTDGNLVIYESNGTTPIWASNTAGSGAKNFLAMQPDANVVLYTSTGTPVWASGTAPPDALEESQGLNSGWFLRSSSGQFELCMQGDGNLVEYFESTPLWASNTAGHPGAYASLQPNGDFVIFGIDGKILWSTNTGHQSNGKYSFAMQSDANVVLYAPSGTAIWANNEPGPNILSVGQSLAPGWFLRSSNGQYTLAMQSPDGNLVVYDNATPIWASGTGGHPGANVAMQTDGNLVVYAPSGGGPLWASNTAGTGSNNYVAMQTDGNLVIYTSSGQPVWASKSSGSSQSQQAISWAESFLPGNPNGPGAQYNGLCLQFVHDAYSAAGVNIGTVGGGSGAAQYWDSDPMGYAEHDGDKNPPVGALVFWGPTGEPYPNPYGHVGIYIGNNTVISSASWPDPPTDPDVHEFSFSGRNAWGGGFYPYLGWMMP